jgi:GNAT superfamily N-acetyltransferase
VLRIRQYRTSDLDRVWALHGVAVKDIGAEAPDSYFADLKQIEAAFLMGGEFVVGEYGGTIVAMGGLKRTSGTRADITRMRVDPAFQRRGFGAAVLQHLERRAGELGFSTLHLDTALEQHDAQQFYMRNGYRRTGSGTKQGFSVVYFEKTLETTRAVCHRLGAVAPTVLCDHVAVARGSSRTLIWQLDGPIGLVKIHKNVLCGRRIGT